MDIVCPICVTSQTVRATPVNDRVTVCTCQECGTVLTLQRVRDATQAARWSGSIGFVAFLELIALPTHLRGPFDC